MLPGAVFGVSFYFSHIWWMKDSVGPDAWIALSAVEALFYVALAPLTAALQRARVWPLWTAAGWAAMEWLRSGWPFSGMPWGRVSYAMADTPVAHVLPYVGVTGLGFLLALSGGLLAWVVAERGHRVRGLVGLAAVSAALLAGVVVPWQPVETGRITVAAVQGDVPGPGNDILLDHRQVTRNTIDATVALADRVAAGEERRPDFVLWPENATAVDPFLDSPTTRGIEEAVAAVGVPVLVAAIVDAGESHILNQGIVWDPVTGPGARYTKRHPVPFGEYIPFRDLMPDGNFGRLAVIGRDMVSGTGLEPIEVAGVTVADAICFDIAYEDVLHDQVARGAELVTVQTSNAMFIHTDQIDQQFAITRLRALETGRYVAVASPNGLTGIIRPDGSVIAQAEPRTTSVLVEQVGLVSALTPAVRMGAWPGRVVVALTLIGLLFIRRSYRPRRSVVPTAATGTDPAGAPGAGGPGSASELEESRIP
jgi:apolipoprotein N-acyltransferase